MDPTIELLTRLAQGLDDHDWLTYAARVGRRWAALGEFERLHALAADGNSPPVSAWPGYTLDDFFLLADNGIRTRKQAREFFKESFS